MLYLSVHVYYVICNAKTQMGYMCALIKFKKYLKILVTQHKTYKQTETQQKSFFAFFHLCFKYGKMKSFYNVTQVTLDFKRCGMKKYGKKVAVLS
jgi:hypothetical protein